MNKYKIFVNKENIRQESPYVYIKATDELNKLLGKIDEMRFTYDKEINQNEDALITFEEDTSNVKKINKTEDALITFEKDIGNIKIIDIDYVKDFEIVQTALEKLQISISSDDLIEKYPEISKLYSENTILHTENIITKTVHIVNVKVDPDNIYIARSKEIGQYMILSFDKKHIIDGKPFQDNYVEIRNMSDKDFDFVIKKLRSKQKLLFQLCSSSSQTLVSIVNIQ